MQENITTGTQQSKTLHEFEKNGLEIVRCSLTHFKGHQLVDIRVFYEDEDGQWRPTRKGITLSVDLIDELFEGVKKLKGVLDG
ncbi:transcriptional coactivator p15/PC4 family protein [Acidobacteria bacterium AH-259-L09]|nr:transcriptional coactivator p15/PC4 family protein [Acidobacteria bacterium AH-259-L09]